MSRPEVLEKRLSLMQNGQVRYELKTLYLSGPIGMGRLGGIPTRGVFPTGLHCTIGGADPETESEPCALPWGVRSGRPSVEQPPA